jgi:hypothetical protein
MLSFKSAVDLKLSFESQKFSFTIVTVVWSLFCTKNASLNYWPRCAPGINFTLEMKKCT